MSAVQPGLLICLVGPSGAGKSSLAAHLMSIYPRVKFSVSYTTRAPRGKERDGVEYHFVSRERFQEMIAEGDFVEHALVHGNLYGTSRSTIDAALNRGEDVLFDIDYQGAQQIVDAFPQTLRVLITPPSLQILEERLRARQTDSEDVIVRRLEAARHELEQYPVMDYVLINDDLETARNALLAVYRAEHMRTHRSGGLIQDMLDT